MLKYIFLLFTGVAILSGCAAKVAYPPDQSTLDACTADCQEKWKGCGDASCQADKSQCIQHCRDYGGLRGGGQIKLQVPFPAK